MTTVLQDYYTDVPIALLAGAAPDLAGPETLALPNVCLSEGQTPSAGIRGSACAPFCLSVPNPVARVPTGMIGVCARLSGLSPLVWLRSALGLTCKTQVSHL